MFGDYNEHNTEHMFAFCGIEMKGDTEDEKKRNETADEGARDCCFDGSCFFIRFFWKIFAECLCGGGVCKAGEALLYQYSASAGGQFMGFGRGVYGWKLLF